VPLFPLHTWLPDAHVEAPTAGSVLLAGVLLKMGTYGCCASTSASSPSRRTNAPWIITLALIGIIYGALVALVQPNMKKLIAYSSVSHLGFVVLGIFSFTRAGMNGAVFQMLAHGIATGALFMLAAFSTNAATPTRSKSLADWRHPCPSTPRSSWSHVLASIGLPLMNGFIGEFLVLSGAFQARPDLRILAATGVIWSACYLLWMYQRVFFGKVTHEVNNALPDLSLREKAALWPIAIAALVMGVAPLVWLGAIDPAVQAALAPVTQLASKVVGQ
jgi:NADH-quinone oxidoreductase subunit M